MVPRGKPHSRVGPARGQSMAEPLGCQGIPLDWGGLVISSRPGIWVRFLASLPGAWMVGSSMGCIRPDGAELSSGLTVGTQSCSAKYVSSSFCVRPTDRGARDSDGMSTMWLCGHGVAPGPPQTPCYRGERQPGLCCSKAGGPASGSGQGNLQREGIKMQAKSGSQLRSIKGSKGVVGDMSRESPAARKGAQ